MRDGRLVAGHVGDTRLYVFRDGRVQKVTHDHSPIGEREDNGELGEPEAMATPAAQRGLPGRWLRAAQPDGRAFIEIVGVPFDEESALLLCSDGLSDLVASAAIARIVYDNADDPERVVNRLVEAANDARGARTTSRRCSRRVPSLRRPRAGTPEATASPARRWTGGRPGTARHSRRPDAAAC